MVESIENEDKPGATISDPLEHLSLDLRTGKMKSCQCPVPPGIVMLQKVYCP
jgi:hypothetical protein